MMLEQKELGNNEEFKDTGLRRNVGGAYIAVAVAPGGLNTPF